MMRYFRTRRWVAALMTLALCAAPALGASKAAKKKGKPGPAPVVSGSSTSFPQYPPFTQHNAVVQGAVFLPGDERVASAGRDGIIRIWEVTTGQQVATIPGQTKVINSLSISQDGKLLASTSPDRSVRVYDIASGQMVHAWTLMREATSSAFSPDGKSLVTGGLHATSHLFDLASWSKTEWSPEPSGGEAAAWSWASNVFATGAGDTKTVCIWDGATHTLLKNLNVKDCHALCFSPDGKLLLSGHSKDFAINLWDVKSGAKVKTFTGHSSSVESIAFLPGGKEFLSSGRENSVILWSIESGQELKRFQPNIREVNSVAVSSDGSMCVTSGEDGTARVSVLSGDGSAVASADGTAPAGAAPAGAATAGGNPPSSDAAPAGPATPAVAATPAPAKPPVAPAKPTVTPTTPLAKAAAPARPATPSIAAVPPPVAPGRPAAIPPSDDKIDRPAYRNQAKAMEKGLTSINSMMVRINSDGSAVGVTADLIATSKPEGHGDGGRVELLRGGGDTMRTSFDEAVRAVKIRYPKWQDGEIEISFGDKYTEHDGGSAGTAFALLILSTLENFDIDAKCAITGDISVDWKVRRVGAVVAKLRGAQLDKCTCAVIPKDNESAVDDLRLLYGDAAVWELQTLSAATLIDAESIVRTDRYPALAEAMQLFASLQPGLAKSERASLQSPATKAALDRILKLAPNHVSARALKSMADNTAPAYLTNQTTMRQVSTVLNPFWDFIVVPEIPSRSTLSTSSVANAKKQLAILRRVGAREMQPVITQIANFIAALDTAAERHARSQDLDNKRGELVTGLTSISTNREVAEKLAREGY